MRGCKDIVWQNFAYNKIAYKQLAAVYSASLHNGITTPTNIFHLPRSQQFHTMHQRKIGRGKYAKKAMPLRTKTPADAVSLCVEMS